MSLPRAFSAGWSVFAFLFVLAGISDHGLAESKIGLGVWANYQYLPGDEDSQKSWGTIGEETLILYADGTAEEGEGRWRYSAELRLGPGSFSDPENNSTGDYTAIHKAWAGWQLDDNHDVIVGKSQVPFGWKTVNFWPGDILLGGYGDQMDVGVKLEGVRDVIDYDFAFFLADDWGSTSTDSVDDNGHWGSSTTYRKIRTWVANLSYGVYGDHILGVSLQKGKLEDLTDIAGNDGDGGHKAAVLYYEGAINDYFAKASFIATERDLPDTYRVQSQSPATIKNQRLALELGGNKGPWSFYIDASAARPQTAGTRTDTVHAYTPESATTLGRDGFIWNI